MSRRFPTPLFGMENVEERCAGFVSVVLEADGPLVKSEFVDRARTRILKADGSQYSPSYIKRIASTYVNLGVVRQRETGEITVWQPARDWYADDIDFETFLWYVLKQNWAIQGEFPDGIEALRRLNRILVNAEGPISKGGLEERLVGEYGYEFNNEGVRGYPTLLCSLGAAEKIDGGYVASSHSARYNDRFRNADILGHFKRWLKREGPSTTPPADRVKRDLTKYYMYRESGGLGRHRRLFDTFRKDFLADDAIEGDPSEPKIRRADAYVEEERNRKSYREAIYDSFDEFTGNDLAGLPTSVLRQMAEAQSRTEARQIKSAAGSGLSRADVAAQADPDQSAYTFPAQFSLYDWQSQAADDWFVTEESNSESGIAEVVTGAGKTVMALEIVRRWLDRNPSGIVTVIVPTNVLMRQWVFEFIEKLNVPADDVGWVGGGHKDHFADGRRVLVSIVNSAIKQDYLQQELSRAGNPPHLLIADECHRYTGDSFSRIFDYHRSASLGLSATPLSTADSDERTASDELLVDELGEIYYRLNYDEALSRDLIPEFRVNYIGFELTPAERQTYERLSQKVSDAVNDIEMQYGNRLYELNGNYAQKLQTIMSGSDTPTPAIGDYFRYTQQRRDLVADAVARQAITLRLLEEAIDEEKKSIVFQERIKQLERIVAPTESRGVNARSGDVVDTDVDRQQLYEQYPELKAVDERLEDLFFSTSYRPVMYHSGHEDGAWNDFAIEWFGDDGFANVMLSVKALVEGVDVPSADVGIVRVSSGSVRQRIQTLGRVLRTGGSAERSELHVIYARDTVDENIFHEHDWEDDLANADVRHLTWEKRDSVLDGSLREATPDEIPEPPEPITIPPTETLSRGDPYEGPREGYRFSVNSEGHPFEKTGDGRRFITNDDVEEIAEYVHRLKGGGTVIVNEGSHAIALHDGQAIFVGTANPDEFEYEDRDGGLTDSVDINDLL